MLSFFYGWKKLFLNLFSFLIKYLVSLCFNKILTNI